MKVFSLNSMGPDDKSREGDHAGLELGLIYIYDSVDYCAMAGVL